MQQLKPFGDRELHDTDLAFTGFQGLWGCYMAVRAVESLPD